MNAPTLVALRLIVLEDRCWPRDGVDPERVQDFARMYLDGGPLAVDPIEVVRTASGHFLLANGRHRLAARELIEASDVAAVVLDAGSNDPIEYAFDYALADSARSALPLTRAEKHRAVLRLIREHPERTDVSIAALVGVSPKTVQRARLWIAANADTSEPADQMMTPRPVRSADVARSLVRQLDRLWAARSLGMAIGVVETSRLGDEIGDAFVDHVGPEQAVAWTERLKTWAARAHAVAVDALQDEA